jgi:site-specific DNA recombinase
VTYFATCGACGSLMSIRRPAGKANRERIYFCKDRGCSSIRYDWLEDYVAGATCALIDHPAFWQALLDPGDDDARAAQAEAAELRRRLAEHVELSAAGKISPAVLAQVEARLTPQIEDADRRAEQTSPVPPALLDLREVHGVDAIRAVWESWPMATRKEIVRAVWDKIDVHKAGRIGHVTTFDPERVTMLPDRRLVKVATAPAAAALPSSRA